jgi:hypothetical protein
LIIGGFQAEYEQVIALAFRMGPGGAAEFRAVATGLTLNSCSASTFTATMRSTPQDGSGDGSGVDLGVRSGAQQKEGKKEDRYSPYATALNRGLHRSSLKERGGLGEMNLIVAL